MVRRRVAAGVGLVLVIVIVLVINGCLKNRAHAALETYGQQVSQLVKESDEQVSHPLFETLSGASAKSPGEVQAQIDEQRALAQKQAAHAREISVPGAMGGAQRNLTLALDLRAEGLTKLAGLVRSALGGQNPNAITNIAGAMELFLASDVIYSQRAAPLISQSLADNGISGQNPAPTEFLPNLGWLEASTVQARITGQSSSSSQNGQLAAGTHGSALKGVSVGATALESEPTLNHIPGGANPTFTVKVEDAGENAETNVKVEVLVESQGKQFKASHTINRTEPGQTVPVDIPVNGVPLAPGKISVSIQPVRGEKNVENNKGSFVALFEK
jgi:hypothetical protein